MKRLQLASDAIMKSKIAAAIGLKDVDLVDRPFGISANTLADFIDLAESTMIQSHLTCDPIIAAIPNAALITSLGAAEVTIADLVAPLRFRFAQNQVIPFKIPVLGYFITTRYTSNTVASSFPLNIRNYFSEGTILPAPPVIYTDLNRQIQVTPTGGGNTSSESLILNVVPPYITSFDGASRDYNVASNQNLSLLSPYYFNNADGVISQEAGNIITGAFIFKDQAAISQQTTVTPILGTSQGVDLLITALNRILTSRGI